MLSVDKAVIENISTELYGIISPQYPVAEPTTSIVASLRQVVNILREYHTLWTRSIKEQERNEKSKSYWIENLPSDVRDTHYRVVRYFEMVEAWLTSKEQK